MLRIRSTIPSWPITKKGGLCPECNNLHLQIIQGIPVVQNTREINDLKYLLKYKKNKKQTMAQLFKNLQKLKGLGHDLI